ncbi:MAG TPA: hypothetical protein VGN20_20665 [Mucilaginibacter sp.]|jgi:hypothetical protein
MTPERNNDQIIVNDVYQDIANRILEEGCPIENEFEDDLDDELNF